MSSTLHSMWFISVVAILAVDVRTGALQQRDMEPRFCHQCTRSNVTNCEQASDWRLVACTAEQPYCATIAVGPDFVSTLACAAANVPACSLNYTLNKNFALTCICAGFKCNTPFSSKLLNELTKFSHSNISNENLTDVFFKSLGKNLSNADIYTNITEIKSTETFKKTSDLTILPTSVPTAMTTVLMHTIEPLPRAEAIKQDVATPSDDEEDEGEGSGSYEETRSHQPAAPAAPSSFLPANDNKATTVFSNLLIIPMFVFLL